MKFTTEIKNGFLYISFEETQDRFTKIILDTLCNKNNIHESDDDLHTKVLLLSDFSQNGTNEYSLNIQDLDTFVLIITINNMHQLSIDYDNLYNNTIKLLTSYCNICLDKVQKERLFLCSLRKNLLDYSVSKNTEDNENPEWLDKAINDYIDLDRILNQEKTDCYDSRCI